MAKLLACVGLLLLSIQHTAGAPAEKSCPDKSCAADPDDLEINSEVSLLQVRSNVNRSHLEDTTTANCQAGAYYSNVDLSSASALHKLVMNGFRRSSYKRVWTALEALDENEESADKVNLLYSKHPLPKPARGSSKDKKKWNREHTWPKSYGVSCKKANNAYDESNGAFTDLHHMFPADVGVNSDRSSEYFDDCTEQTCTYPANPDDGYTKEEQESGESKDDTTFWMPPKKSRGVVARAMLYMALRYDGEEKNTVDLTLSECPRYCHHALGKLSVLKRWHSEFPPTAAETTRNNEVCGMQGNRNPFVDHPDLVDALFGTSPSASLVSSDCSSCGSSSPRAGKCSDIGKTTDPGESPRPAPAPASPRRRSQPTSPRRRSKSTSRRRRSSGGGGSASGSCATYGCGARYDKSRKCQCNRECKKYNNCCSDFSQCEL